MYRNLARETLHFPNKLNILYFWYDIVGMFTGCDGKTLIILDLGI